MTPRDDQDAAVLRAFTEWSATMPGAPRDAASLVESIEVSHEHIGLLSTEWQGRRVQWKTVPYAGKARVQAPPPDLERVDPWSADEQALRTRSDHVRICSQCNGDGKVSCVRCGSSGKLICGSCRGQAKIYGYTANGARRLLNCQDCRGKGDVDCPDCRRGIATCPTCAGEKRLQSWMEIERWSRTESVAHPVAAAQQFRWTGTSSKAELEADGVIVADVARPRRLSADDIAPIPESWLGLAKPGALGERAMQQHLRIVRVPNAAVSYRLGGQRHQAQFSGRRLIPPPPLPDNPFSLRYTRLRGAAFFLLLLWFAFAMLYLLRGLYYWSAASLLPLGAFSVGVLMLFLGFVDLTGLRRQVPRWMAAAAAFVALAFLAAFAVRPRPDDVRERIAAGNLDGAEEELRVLAGPETPALWADLHLARITASKDIGEARKELAAIPADLPQYAVASRTLDNMLVKRALMHVEGARFEDGAALLDLVSETGRRTADVRAAAEATYVPLVRQHLRNDAWEPAGVAIRRARTYGVTAEALDPLSNALREAAAAQTEQARAASSASARLKQSQTAEATWVAWEKSADAWGTRPLVALRSAMAKDVAALEARRRR